MARRAAASTLIRRLLSTTSPPPRVARPSSELMSKPPYNMISYLGDWRLTEKAMKHPGMDYEHWFVQISRPRERGVTEQNIVDCFIHNALRPLLSGKFSPNEIVNKVYKVEFGPKVVGFGCEIDWITKEKLEETAGFVNVVKITEDYYLDPKYKDYGGDLVVNGKIIKRESRSRDEEVVVREK